jgi:DEAD/DEAH box helicase domain-containing protein
LLAALKEDPALREALRHHEVVSSRPASLAERLPARFEPLAEPLHRRGIGALYQHQVRAAELIAAGRDVVLATPTASGKTLVYNLPVLRGLQEEPPARALYLFPLKALERDQRARLEADIAALRLGAHSASVAIYDGDTPTAQRQRLRKNPPNVLITTPDMLHHGLLPHHGAWQAFFAGLATLVIDELHTYRGIFGSHIAQLLRRLLRVAAYHGARPQLVAASATIANPGELAEALTGRRFAVVQVDGAPRPRRHFLLLNPPGSPYTAAARLFRLAVGLGLRTIAFTKARRITELMHTWVVEAEPGLRDRISSYRAGFLPEERREIEQRLFRGDLLGVISTSALEMGIDVGSLDVCLLVGYPGSQMATWQRAGRVGRSREAAVLLVAQPDALDQFLVSHPRAFFDLGFEHAVTDPHNPEVAAGHLPCAAAELPLRCDEPWLAEPGTAANLSRLEERGLLLRSEAGREWFAARRRPHRDVDLRSAGASYVIELEPEENGRPAVVGTVGAGRVLAECHEGAIYLHRGRQFLVTRLELDARRVRVRPVSAPYFTRALSDKETEILSRERARPCGNLRLVGGRLRVTTRISGFERRRVHGQDLLGTEALELPPSSIETRGIWLEIPEEVCEAVRSAGGHPMGGLHAIEHATLALFPLFTLCDRHDVSGISTLRHPQVEGPAVFLYDSHAGGAGLAASLFERAEALLSATLELVEGCSCDSGCPGCVHSPKCGSGNRPIDKAAALQALRLLLGNEPLPCGARPTEVHTVAEDTRAPAPARVERPGLLFLDLETQRSADDVGGWHNAHLMRVAIAVLYDAREDRFECFEEKGVQRLLDRLSCADLVVGFNVRGFDYRVLRGYTDRDLSDIPTFDLLEAIHSRLGFRLSLGHLAEETLGATKSADGLQALRWWKEGRLDEITRYCRRDVALLRNLFEWALERGHLLFRTRSGERVRIPTPWSLGELIERARAALPPPRQCSV